MDLVALKREYLSQRGADLDSDSDIDVVGDSGAESEGFPNSLFSVSSDTGMDLTSTSQDEKIRRANPFSIESLLNT